MVMKQAIQIFAVLGLLVAPSLANADDPCADKKASVIKKAIIEGGQVVLARCDGAVVNTPLLKEQTGADKLQISVDRSMVGWAVLQANCCTSYDVPTVLVVYHQGKFTTLTPPHAPQMIWDWEFKQGARIAMRSGPTHGDMCVNSVYDVRTGKKVSEKDCVNGM